MFGKTNAVQSSGGGGGDGITVNQIIRAFDLAEALINKKVILTEADYTNANIEIMIDLMEKTVG